MELEHALAVTLVAAIVITHDRLPAWFALAVAAVLLAFVLAAAYVQGFVWDACVAAADGRCKVFVSTPHK